MLLHWTNYLPHACPDSGMQLTGYYESVDRGHLQPLPDSLFLPIRTASGGDVSLSSDRQDHSKHTDASSAECGPSLDLHSPPGTDSAASEASHC